MANAGGMTSVRIRDPRRWAVTLGGLAVYGLGSRLWLPGLDPEAVTRMAVPVPSANLSIFAVGVRPILFGLAFVEMARVVFPPLARWAAGARDRSEYLWRTARLFALALAASQAMGIARAVEGLDGLAPSPGPMFRLGVVAAIVGATAFLIWLARVMTERGVGDGLLILFAAPFIAHLLFDVAAGLENVGTGLQPDWGPLALAALLVAALALLIAATRTDRRRRPPRYLVAVDWNLGLSVVDRVFSPGRFRRPADFGVAFRPPRWASGAHLALRRLARARAEGRLRTARRRNPRLWRRAGAGARARRRRAR